MYTFSENIKLPKCERVTAVYQHHYNVIQRTSPLRGMTDSIVVNGKLSHECFADFSSSSSHSNLPDVPEGDGWRHRGWWVDMGRIAQTGPVSVELGK